MSNIRVGRVRPVWKGRYKADRAYEFYDWVSYNGGSYIVVKKDGAPAGIPPTDNLCWACTSSKGATGSAIIGQLITSIVPLTDSSLLLLDGRVVSSSSPYREFVDYVESLIEEYPQLFVDEETWQQLADAFGACGKFVFSVVDGIKTVRLPKISSIMMGTSDIEAAGDLLVASVLAPAVSLFDENEGEEGEEDPIPQEPEPTFTATTTYLQGVQTLWYIVATSNASLGEVTKQDVLTGLEAVGEHETIPASLYIQFENKPVVGGIERVLKRLYIKNADNSVTDVVNDSLPFEGEDGQVLRKLGDGSEWADQYPEGNTGQLLAKTEDGVEWVDQYPEGNKGEVLVKTDDAVEWKNLAEIDALPDDGEEGQFLSVDEDGKAKWVDIQDELPEPGDPGQLLVLDDDSKPVWADAPSSLPEGGTTGQILEKTDEGSAWKDKYPADGEPGQVLTKTEDGTEWKAGLPEDGEAGQALVIDENGVVSWGEAGISASKIIASGTEEPPQADPPVIYVKYKDVASVTTVADYVASPNWYRRPQLMTVTRTAVTIPAKTQINIGDRGFMSMQDTTLSISTVGTAQERAGKDVFVYACIPSAGSEPTFVLSLNSTVPTGYTAENSRKIGGFHCLCVAVGTISGHALSGYVAGDILPRTVWDLKHRARGSQAGMALDYDGVWKGIYLASWDGSRLVSVFGAEIADGVSSKEFNGETFAYQIRKQGDRLLWRDEFALGARGSNEGTIIAGSADPNTTGGHVDTSGRRMISDIGLEDCCGALWQSGADCYESWAEGKQPYNQTSFPYALVYSNLSNGTTAWNPVSVNNAAYDPVERGYCYGLLRRVRLGGSWLDGSKCGSRSASCHDFSSCGYANCAARLGSEPLQVV